MALTIECPHCLGGIVLTKKGDELTVVAGTPPKKQISDADSEDDFFAGLLGDDDEADPKKD